MFEVTLRNNRKFNCDSDKTIFESARQNGILLEHSCLTGRCRSCVGKVTQGETKDKVKDLVLSAEEKQNGFVLTCNSIPTSDVKIDIEDLGDVTIYPKKIIPSKIDVIEHLNDEVLKISLRLPPTANFLYNAGQYVNLIKNNISRSYSVANFNGSNLEFYIKNYPGGEMSSYWFNQSAINNLVRVEGPLGSFFLRESNKRNLIFLGTGTGIAPIKAILEYLEGKKEKIQEKSIWVFSGARSSKDIFWTPIYEEFEVNFVQVLSREQNQENNFFYGYVQEAVLSKQIDLTDAQVYACGSNDMIQSSRELLIRNGLEENHFFSDAFVQTN